MTDPSISHTSSHDILSPSLTTSFVSFTIFLSSRLWSHLWFLCKQWHSLLVGFIPYVKYLLTFICKSFNIYSIWILIFLFFYLDPWQHCNTFPALSFAFLWCFNHLHKLYLFSCLMDPMINLEQTHTILSCINLSSF